MWLKNGWTTPNPSLRKRKHVGSLLAEDESKSKDLVLKLAEDESKRKSIDAALLGPRSKPRSSTSIFRRLRSSWPSLLKRLRPNRGNLRARQRNSRKQSRPSIMWDRMKQR